MSSPSATCCDCIPIKRGYACSVLILIGCTLGLGFWNEPGTPLMLYILSILVNAGGILAAVIGLVGAYKNIPVLVKMHIGYQVIVLADCLIIAVTRQIFYHTHEGRYWLSTLHTADVELIFMCATFVCWLWFTVSVGGTLILGVHIPLRCYKYMLHQANIFEPTELPSILLPHYKSPAETRPVLSKASSETPSNLLQNQATPLQNQATPIHNQTTPFDPLENTSPGGVTTSSMTKPLATL